MSAVTRDDRRTAACWTGLAVLLVLEYALFRQAALRDVVPTYPRAFDQVQYLTDSYDTYERIRQLGLGSGLVGGATLRPPQGFFVHLEAALLFLLLGPGRLSALTLNFLHFAALQVALVFTLRWLTRTWSAPALALGLLLAAGVPFYAFGGLMDFRLDFGAMCLYGLFLCAVVRARLLADLRGAAVAGVLGGACVLFRYITLPYVLGALGALALVAAWMGRTGRWTEARGVFRGALLAAGVVVALAAPALWASRAKVMHYYVQGHLTGEEKAVRAREFGGGFGWEAFVYYPRSLARDHAGQRFAGLVALALGIAAVGRFVRPAADPRDAGGPPPGRAAGLLVFLAASVLVPLAILTPATSKSPVVIGVAVPGLVWIVTTLFWLGTGRPAAPAWIRRAAAALAAVALGAGLWTHASRLVRRPLKNATADTGVLNLYDHIAASALRNGWNPVLLADNTVSASLYGKLLSPLAYEHRGTFLATHTLLGDGVLAVKETEALDAIARSHFVALGPPPRPTSPFPFDAVMRAMDRTLRTHCEDQFLRVGRYTLPDGEVTLYERPSVRFEGTSGDWITSAGLTVVGDVVVLARRPVIELGGPLNMTLLGGRLPRARARLEGGTSEPGVPAELSRSAQGADDEYLLRLRLDPASVGGAAEARILVTFDTFFVPARMGYNSDTRELVIPRPTTVRLLPGSTNP
jgi:hypothetical protein